MEKKREFGYCDEALKLEHIAKNNLEYLKKSKAPTAPGE